MSQHTHHYTGRWAKRRCVCDVPSSQRPSTARVIRVSERTNERPRECFTDSTTNKCPYKCQGTCHACGAQRRKPTNSARLWTTLCCPSDRGPRTSRSRLCMKQTHETRGTNCRVTPNTLIMHASRCHVRVGRVHMCGWFRKRDGQGGRVAWRPWPASFEVGVSGRGCHARTSTQQRGKHFSCRRVAVL